MKINILPALTLTVLCIILFVAVYSGIIWGIARLAGPNLGDGEVVMADNRIAGFKNVGQAFTDDKYFSSRPSAVNYNAAGSGGSNKGPSNPEYLKQVGVRTAEFIKHNPGVNKSAIPAELVTASGSGLDPHISPRAAQVQIQRIARARKLSADEVQELVNSLIEKPWLGVFGPSRINVLQLNVALDNVK